MSLSLGDKDHIIQMFEYQFCMVLDLDNYAEAYIGIHAISAHMCNLLII